MLGGEGDSAEGSAVKYCVRRLILVVKIEFCLVFGGCDVVVTFHHWQ